MMKMLEYILNRGAKAIVTAIPAPTTDPVTVNDCFEKVFEHEVDNTKSIYKVVKWHSMKKIGLHGISYNGS
jgi:ferritin